MATMTITIPDDHIADIITSLCYVYDYTNTQLEGETQTQFSKRMVNKILRSAIQHAYKQYLASSIDISTDITTT